MGNDSKLDAENWTDADTRDGVRLIAKPWGEWTKADSKKAGRLLAKAPLTTQEKPE